jgi:c-di-GMP-binding flagellar brake protein YcgR
MNIETSTDLSLDAGHSGPDYARRNPLEIGVQLRNLVNRGDFLTVQYPGGQLVTRLLDVDVGARTFTFDWGALAEQNAGILAASHCTFAAAAPACASSSPPARRARRATRAARVRRRIPRGADVHPAARVLPRRCAGRRSVPVSRQAADGEGFVFEVQNLSLGGVGLRTIDERVETLEVGTLLPEVELELNGHGKLSLDLRLVSQRSTQLPNGSRRHQLGFRFMSLPGSAENTLQRLITQLEMKRRRSRGPDAPPRGRLRARRVRIFPSIFSIRGRYTGSHATWPQRGRLIRIAHVQHIHEPRRQRPQSPRSGASRRPVRTSATPRRPAIGRASRLCRRERPVHRERLSAAGREHRHVQRQYSQYLSDQLNAAQSQGGAQSTWYSLVAQLNNYVGSPTAGISTAITNYFTGLQNVANNASDPSVRQTAISNAQILADQLKATGQQYDALRQSVNTQLTSTVSQINTYTAQIAQLNQQIGAASSQGQPPNQLLDQRDLAVSNLSSLAGVQVVRNDSGYSVFLAGASRSSPTRATSSPSRRRPIRAS